MAGPPVDKNQDHLSPPNDDVPAAQAKAAAKGASVKRETKPRSTPTKQQPPPAVKPEREIPQNIEAERALLGSMMMDRSVIDDVAGLIPGRQAFYVPQHGTLYEALLRLHALGHPMDLIVAVDFLKREGLCDYVGGQDYLIELAESFADWSNATYYARVIVSHWQRRELIRLAGEITKAGYDAQTEDPGEECSRFQRALDGIIELRVGNDVRRIDALFKPAMESLKGGDHGYLECGIPTFDQRAGGLQRPGLVVMAARPSVGKTTVAVNMLYRMGWNGVPGMLISAEMEDLQVGLRTMCALSGDNVSRLKKVASDADATHTVELAQRAARGAPVYINDQPKTLRKIVSCIRTAVRQYKLGVVAIDYLQLIRADGRWENKNAEITEISNTLAKLSKEMKIVLLLLSQLNREAANSDGSAPPTMDMLRDSGSIEQDADQVIMLYPGSWTEWRRTPTPILFLDMQKNRNGPTMDCQATFDMPSFRLQFGISEPSLMGQRPTQDDIPF